MTDDIARLLDDASNPPTDPSIIDSDGIVEAGRRRVRRRRLGVASGSAGAIAAIAVVAMLVPGLAPGAAPGSSIGEPGKEAPTDRTGIEQPVFPYPSIDPQPGWTYVWDWDDPGAATESTVPYTAAVVDWLDERPLVARPMNEDVDGSTPIVPELIRAERIVTGSDEDGSREYYGEPVPRYETAFTVGTDTEVAAEVTVEIWPNGSFAPGEGTTFAHLYTCDTQVRHPDGQPSPVGRTCTHDEIDGQPVLAVVEVYGEGELLTVTLRMVYYRADGVAIVLTESYESTEPPRTPSDTPIPAQDLASLLTAMPMSIVD